MDPGRRQHCADALGNDGNLIDGEVESRGNVVDKSLNVAH